MKPKTTLTLSFDTTVMTKQLESIIEHTTALKQALESLTEQEKCPNCGGNEIETETLFNLDNEKIEEIKKCEKCGYSNNTPPIRKS